MAGVKPAKKLILLTAAINTTTVNRKNTYRRLNWLNYVSKWLICISEKNNNNNSSKFKKCITQNTKNLQLPQPLRIPILNWQNHSATKKSVTKQILHTEHLTVLAETDHRYLCHFRSNNPYF